MARRGRAGRWLSQGALPLCLAACAVLLVCGAYLPGPGLRHALPWALLVLAVLAAVGRQARGVLLRKPLPLGGSAEGALGLGLGALALTQLTGAQQGPLTPLLYLLGAGYVLALPLPLAAVLITALVALDTALVLSAPPALLPALALQARWPVLASHLGFTLLFAALYHALLAARLRRLERAGREAVSRRVAEAEESARELRLVATSDPSAALCVAEPGAATPSERELLSAVAEVEEALRGALSVAEAALRPHTVAVFLVAPDGESVRLRECVSKSERLFRGPLPVREGALGAVLASGRPVRLEGDGPALAYYEGNAEAVAFCGVPLRERGLERRADSPEGAAAELAASGGQREGAVLGALIADRDAPFSSDDERVLCALAAEVVRAIEAERLLSAVRREKEEKQRFFRALTDLNRTRGVAEAARIAVEHARSMCAQLDLCAVTLAEEPLASEVDPALPRKRGPGSRPRLRHRVLAASGDGTAPLQGLSFADNPGLVSNVVRLGSALPGRELGAMDRIVIFDSGTTVRGLAALKIFPLRAGEATLGTLVCGSRSKGGLTAAAQHELSMLALSAGEALQRTRLFEQTERLATIDGLTGLFNRRTMQEQLTARLREAQRYQLALSFVLLDIDHFKKVNDTYGHPAGDAVLRGVAAVAQAQARETDIVARYGGEEMALILPGTDAAGARVIAERLRAAIEAEEHPTDAGALRCTVSIGVSSYPGCGEGVAALIEAADQALYRAKQSGRNRVESARGRAAA